eukprot:5669087-Prymnesium_polylepis.2
MSGVRGCERKRRKSLANSAMPAWPRRCRACNSAGSLEASSSLRSASGSALAASRKIKRAEAEADGRRGGGRESALRCAGEQRKGRLRNTASINTDGGGESSGTHGIELSDGGAKVGDVAAHEAHIAALACLEHLEQSRPCHIGEEVEQRAKLQSECCPPLCVARNIAQKRRAHYCSICRRCIENTQHAHLTAGVAVLCTSVPFQIKASYARTRDEPRRRWSCRGASEMAQLLQALPPERLDAVHSKMLVQRFP